MTAALLTTSEADPRPAPPSPRAGLHWEMLVLSAAAILLAFFFQVRPDGRVVVPGLHDHPLPQSCVSARLGFRCPGCGMTRSFVQLAHGQWRDAWHFHRLGWLIFGVAVLQIPYRLTCIYRSKPPLAGTRVPNLFSWSLIVLLLANWLVGFWL